MKKISQVLLIFLVGVSLAINATAQITSQWAVCEKLNFRKYQK